MKTKSVLSILIFLFFQNVFSQQGIEKSVWNIQTGILGFWISNEQQLSKEISLRSEIGFDAGIFGGTFYDKTGFFLTPVINVEPRWYYNINSRISKKRNIKNNCFNFTTVSLNYHPDWFVISNYNTKIAEQISIIPKWGIKRSFGNSNFIYEIGTGVGFRYYFVKQYGFSKNEVQGAIDLHLKIGYSF